MRRKAKDKDSQKIRYAVVGLGHLAQVAVLPAFENAANSELANDTRNWRRSSRATRKSAGS